MKSELREKYLIIRKSIKDKTTKDELIFNSVINDEDYIRSNTIGIYYSLKSEVDTLKLIRYSLTHNKIVLLPRVEGSNMSFYPIDSLDNLCRSSFGIMEPVGETIFPKEGIDLLIVPGLVFDKNKNRIGFGRGYYDKYLFDYKGTTIGICYEEQMTEEIIPDEFDVKLKKIITEKCVY